jgi:FkbM family methyltransferase
MGTIELIMRKMLKRVRDRRVKRLLSDFFGHQPVIGFPSFLIKGINHIQSLRKIDDFSLKYLNEEWICHIEGLEFVINSTEELLILEEVFINGTYNVEINHPFIFIDIGMNVGITSLYFAKKPTCKKVVAFEPFQPTLTFAIKNFAINDIAQKIQVNEVGLGYPPRMLTISYSEESKGSVGIHGVASYIEKKKDIREEQLPIIDVFEALNEIKDEKIVLKIDCEGSEYEILDRLNDTGLLDRFDVIMIEWHIKGPAPLLKILHDNNFDILSMGKHNSNIGMLYAFKK